MSMSDCSSCWETPCVCGKGYKHLSTKELKELVHSLTETIREKEFLAHDPMKRYHKGKTNSVSLIDGVFRRDDENLSMWW